MNTVNEHKICPNCGKKFLKEDYIKKHKRWATKGQIDSWWKSRKYCSYDCSKESGKRRMLENYIERKENKDNYNELLESRIQLWKIENGEIKQIKVYLFGEWKLCELIGD